MSKLTDAFGNRKALIPFLTCGDPNLETTKNLVISLAQHGADIIELGIPFSDPTAEGPIIQEASLRALKQSTTTDKIFAMVKDIRKETDIPLVFMTYANVVFSYGTERFLQACEDLGINGLILPDVPYEEKEEFAIPCKAHGVDFISMIAPTSKERVQMIASQAEGFLYLVSSLGVTGERSDFASGLDEIVEQIRAVSEIPVAIGFGIHTPEQAGAMAALSDGAIVGSAVVKMIGQYGENCLEPVSDFVSALKDGITIAAQAQNEQKSRLATMHAIRID